MLHFFGKACWSEIRNWIRWYQQEEECASWNFWCTPLLPDFTQVNVPKHLLCLCILLRLQFLGYLWTYNYAMVLPILCEIMWLWKMSDQTECTVSDFVRLCTDSEPFAGMQLQTAHAKLTFPFNSLCNSFENPGFLWLHTKFKFQFSFKSVLIV